MFAIPKQLSVFLDLEGSSAGLISDVLAGREGGDGWGGNCRGEGEAGEWNEKAEESACALSHNYSTKLR